MLAFRYSQDSLDAEANVPLRPGFVDFQSQASFPIVNAYSTRPSTRPLDEEVDRFVREWALAGVALAVVKNGRLVFAKGYGLADRELKIPTQPYHLFRIASVSKLFTAVGIMKLVEADKLRLDDTVFGPKGILNDPVYQNIADPLAEKIQVRHLLNHTGGWRNVLRRDPMFVPVEVAEIMGVPAPPSIETTIQFMLSQTNLFEPGQLYDYSNFGYCVLGKVVEKITGTSYETYMQEQVLRPLGITRMRLGKTRRQDKVAHESVYYTPANAPQNISCFGTGDSTSRAYEGTYMEGLEAAGGWIASVVDLMRFLVAIDGFPTKPDILSPASINEMTYTAGDSTGHLLLGWKGADAEKWWRTGSLAATHITLVRKHNGISYVFVTNTGTWRGPYFSYEIEAMMERALRRVRSWPLYDLFVLPQ
ncbi:MAG: beta-lactamase family protein [Bacteroidia bacterium]|nr:beta-lactamase family protein [Bacteroidia bacterium]